MEYAGYCRIERYLQLPRQSCAPTHGNLYAAASRCGHPYFRKYVIRVLTRVLKGLKLIFPILRP